MTGSSFFIRKTKTHSFYNLDEDMVEIKGRLGIITIQQQPHNHCHCIEQSQSNTCGKNQKTLTKGRWR